MDTQLEFCWRDEASLHRELEERTGLRVHLTLTDNTSSMLTVRRDASGGGAARVRLHRMFLSAGPSVVKALALWIERSRCRRSGGVLDAFIRDNRHLIRPRGPRPGRLVMRGECHDLAALYDEVNAAEFDGTVTARITWGRMPTKRRRRSIRFGSYDGEADLVRIHPFLDRPFVPAYFVRYIVFHEMLHAYLGVGESPGGRRRVHGADFKAREEAYGDFERALAWQGRPRNLARLLR